MGMGQRALSVPFRAPLPGSPVLLFLGGPGALGSLSSHSWHICQRHGETHETAAPQHGVPSGFADIAATARRLTEAPPLRAGLVGTQAGWRRDDAAWLAGAGCLPADNRQRIVHIPTWLVQLSPPAVDSAGDLVGC